MPKSEVPGVPVAAAPPKLTDCGAPKVLVWPGVAVEPKRDVCPRPVLVAAPPKSEGVAVWPNKLVCCGWACPPSVPKGVEAVAPKAKEWKTTF